MALTTPPITSEEASKAMLDGLIDRIRSELRARILDRIEPDITAAVDAALGSFKVAIESFHEPHMMRNTVQVLIERRDIALSSDEREKP